MQKEIKVSFYADVDEKKIDDIFRVLDKCGADIVTNDLPELSNIGRFMLEVLK